MFIVGAPTLRYGEIVAVIDAAKGAGAEKVGIVTEGMRKQAGVSRRRLAGVRVVVFQGWCAHARALFCVRAPVAVPRTSPRR